MEDIEANLRLFALRKAAEESGAGGGGFEEVSGSNRVVVSVQAAPDRSCPMHGRHGSYQLPSPERPSRKEMARELRMSVAREEAAARAARSGSYSVERTLSMGGHGGGGGAAVRSYSLEYNSGYNSVPRRMSSTAATKRGGNVDRRGSFGNGGGGGKVAPRDVFKGKVDFKTILRRFDPKEEERSHSSSTGNIAQQQQHLIHRGRSRHDSEEFSSVLSSTSSSFSRQRGSIVDSDFDFRGGASREPVWDNPGRFRYVGSATSSAANSRPTSPRPQSQPPLSSGNTTRQLRIDVESANEDHHHRGATSNPVSPRKVEFGEQVVFDFDPRQVRSAVSSPTPPQIEAAGNRKPILRHTTSGEQQQQRNPESLMQQYQRKVSSTEAPPSHQTEISNGDSLVQIYVPDNSGAPGSTTDEEDSDDTIEEGGRGELKRQVPPPLGECWNRSQSFPPPRTSHENRLLDADAALRKHSLQEEEQRRGGKSKT